MTHYDTYYRKESFMNRLEIISHDLFQLDLKDCSDAQVYQVLLELVKQQTTDMPTNDHQQKKVYYFSAEFLIGKLLSNNLLNLGIYDQVNKVLQANGKNMMDIEEAEHEPSLGNGGLGRLAACFVDSMTTLGLNGDGIGLNYHFGLFQQVFKNNQQVAVPDAWLTEKSWLQQTRYHFEVPFKDFSVQSDLYDLDILGYGQERKNRLRLFDLSTVSSDIIEGDGIDFDKTNIQENLTLFLYPDDSDHNGELLRIYQQYFMVSNGAQLIIQEALEKGSNLHNLADYAVIQINDTHPAMVIPEMIRLLTDQYDLEFDEAVSIVQSMTAYTNHTILAEALEKWPLQDIGQVAPRIAEIIELLDARTKETYQNPNLAIIDSLVRVHMAHLAIHYGFSINGVAALHTDILKESELRDFYEVYPEKFNNKTNGITFRRWIMDANKELANYYDEILGDQWRFDHDLTHLASLTGDQAVKDRLSEIKQANKQKLQRHLQHKMGVDINPNSIIDVQIKRIHEYKRQQMLALYIIHKYLDIKAGNIPARPITILFGGKAANAYTIARDIIHLILNLSEMIANDPQVSPHFQVVMVENYNVTSAQFLIPAADISEQISLASKEASGTGNMKFMLNGALTVCTMDGANVEIADLVGPDNIYVFGKDSDTIVDLYATGDYVARNYYEREAIKPLVDFIVSDEMLALGDETRLRRLHQDMINKDWFMALIDLEEFIAIKEVMYQDYENQDLWMDKVMKNMAQAGFFSSDRTIRQYNEDIWKLA